MPLVEILGFSFSRPQFAVHPDVPVSSSTPCCQRSAFGDSLDSALKSICMSPLSTLASADNSSFAYTLVLASCSRLIVFANLAPPSC
ncbi:hypothetical protein K438DRAFT_312796 [Mycena galopus ATCC 62051]|nr:hypothetical protein K438DRAFT_312796 [Mycena galopus ATCC 62051]